jgi:hypothetical protein
MTNYSLFHYVVQVEKNNLRVFVAVIHAYGMHPLEMTQKPNK